MRAQSTIQPLAQQSLGTALLPPPIRVLWLLLLLLILFACVTPAQAQSDPNPAKPYATLDRQGVTYRGPVRAEDRDAPNGEAVIGLILPLRGPQETEGRAVLTAAQLALDEEQARGPLPDGRRLKLVARDESGPWGQASVEILKLIEEDQALAILASANGTTAHLADQIANKISVPILTLSSDPSTTQANVPWLFRVGPSDTDQARAFCQHIYSDLGVHRVLLVAEADYDGRVGSTEFEKVTKERNAAAPVRVELADGPTDLQGFRATLQITRPEAIVLWTGAPFAEKLLQVIRSERLSLPVFLCRKAAQLHTTLSPQIQDSAGSFSVDFSTRTQLPMHATFEHAYAARTGNTPGLATEDAYAAIRIITAAIRQTGASPTLLREYFAREPKPNSATQIIRFDPAGNSIEPFSVIRLNTSDNIAAFAPGKPPDPANP